MKLCIPTQTNDGLKAEVSGHFGSAAYFMIYEVETDSYELSDCLAAKVELEEPVHQILNLATLSVEGDDVEPLGRFGVRPVGGLALRTK